MKTPPPLKSGPTPHPSKSPIGFLVQNNSQYSENYEKINFQFSFLEKLSILYSKFNACWALQCFNKLGVVEACLFLQSKVKCVFLYEFHMFKKLPNILEKYLNAIVNLKGKSFFHVNLLLNI